MFISLHIQNIKNNDAMIFFRWKTSFFVSLIFGVPVMVIMIYFHWIIKAPMHPERQIPVFVPALSLDNMLLLLLATPVQVCIIYPGLIEFIVCLDIWRPVVLCSKLESD